MIGVGLAGGAGALLLVAMIEPVSASSNIDTVAVISGAAIAIIIRGAFRR